MYHCFCYHSSRLSIPPQVESMHESLCVCLLVFKCRVMIYIVCVVILSRSLQCMLCVVVIAWCEHACCVAMWMVHRVDVCRSKVAFFKAFLPTPSQIVCHFGKTSSHGCFTVFCTDNCIFLALMGISVSTGRNLTICEAIFFTYQFCLTSQPFVV